MVCLDCGRPDSRAALDRRLRAANPAFHAETTRINPDGDVDLPEHAVRRFRLVDCPDCGSDVVKPSVVFFGESVPRAVVDDCYRRVDEAEAVLVLGSSLTVMSGLRFVRRAARAGTPVLIVNRGETRGDPHARARVDLPLGPALTELAERLGCAVPPAVLHSRSGTSTQGRARSAG